MFRHVKSYDEVTLGAGRIIDTLNRPVIIDQHPLQTTGSVGVSLYPRDGQDMVELLKHSDTAMYQAKDRGRNNVQMFSQIMNRKLKQRVAVEASLREALRLKQLDVHFQPFVNLHTRKIVGLEALMRWCHPQHGMVPADQFIPVAEETGLIVPMGNFVLHRTMQIMTGWRKAGIALVPVALNVAPAQLQRGELLSTISTLLKTHALRAELIQLEMTERAVFDSHSPAGENRQDTMARLRDLGIKIAIDDFGTGYSSLSYLKNWRVDALKIDRSFVRDLVTDSSDLAIVSAIIAIAKHLRIQVIAEGIEGYQQAEILRRLGCTVGQGYPVRPPHAGRADGGIPAHRKRFGQRRGRGHACGLQRRPSVIARWLRYYPIARARIAVLSSRMQPSNYLKLPPRCYTRLLPTPVAAPRLLRFNAALGHELGMPVDTLDPATVSGWFSGNATPAGAEPLATVYAGHQFGHFVPQLGDGRAILLGELQDADGRPFDIQLKGSGRTPYSRNGDGRAALGPILREYVVSEAMHALGIPTTRALAAVATGEPVYRERVMPGAIVTRVAASHVRVGTFEYFAARADLDALQALADYVIERHYPTARQSARPALALLAAVAERQAALVAAWMQVGFVHGVMNTDNMAVGGETIDFGPCAFLDDYHADAVFSSIDQHGRYAYANQPSAAAWNLARLGEALLPLIDSDPHRAIALANETLAGFHAQYAQQWLQGWRRKLGPVAAAAGRCAAGRAAAAAHGRTARRISRRCCAL